MTFENDNLPQGKIDHFIETSNFGPKPLWNLIHQMDAYFQQFFQQMNTHLIPNSLSVDTYEANSKMIVEVKLPGCNRNQIQLEIIGNRLRIGVEDSFHEEINYPTHTGRKQFFQRREHIVSLPYTIPEKEAKVSFHNELLKITFPKEHLKRRYLTIED
ncbi:Hsp20/alpha crystallin family protein [Psychrobacillus sp. FSL H8-0483]|uniref:Hsp20/alpha crystallin family protein n=1 Tax=Psychrobacillus sp. FSL H8-0483 TaxID=2921389 RepID=UPI003159C7B5